MIAAAVSDALFMGSSGNARDDLVDGGRRVGGVYWCVGVC